MADFKKTMHKTFSFEEDLCRFLRSGQVEDVISINAVGTGYVLFYVRNEQGKQLLKEKKQTDKGLDNG